MKKKILIICAVAGAFGLTAFGFVNLDYFNPKQKEVACKKPTAANVNFINPWLEHLDPDLVYDVEPRFLARITKQDLHNAKSIIEILPEEGTENLFEYKNVTVSVLDEADTKTEDGNNEFLSPAQKKLLESTNYSSNIRITADCLIRNPYTGISQNYDLSYHMSIIPEKEATFKSGYEELVKYLKENSKEKAGIIGKGSVRPGRVFFTVTKGGTIDNVRLDVSCGYPSVDEKLVEIITNMPENWEPATNSNGEHVDQELVFFFGSKGC